MPAAVIDEGAARKAFETGMTSAIQGDMRAALPHLRRAAAGGLKPEARKAVETCLARFDPPVPQAASAELDPWTAKLLSVYRGYWTRAMLGIVSREAGERELGEALAQLVGLRPEPGQAVDLNALEPKLEAQLKVRGYHALFGVTSPYRELLLWKAEEDKNYEVELPEGREQVPVAMLDDFISLGWVGYATGDRYHTGGWTEPNRLYCLRSSYDLGSETFKVSYLAHEGQHFADARRFPALEQPELEYRAKLVEIAKAESTQGDLMRGFNGNVSTRRDQPHPFANQRLMDDLAKTLIPGRPVQGEWWKAIPPSSIRAAAERLLKEDSARLQR